jgi:two-component system sensor histidine kinase KdpD
METRPDPDQLLKRVQAEEIRRGKLKIFFGATAGVGKTYAMLEAARARRKEGVDVVVGYVETHKRAETEALLAGLEVLPRKRVDYKGVWLPEFDIDAALARNPSLMLVDELAHTNAAGSRHLKRWGDVEELLNAGVDVYTTLNVQHCESVNDVIAQVTGVVVRETVPDTFIEKAADIELIDLPSEDLLKRLREGKVYLGAQADRAAENFFKPGNLIALRQLALRYTAKNVDVKMRNFREGNAVAKIWNVGEHFLVCISENPSAVNLIRAAKRIASEIGAPWTVAYVETPSSLHATENDKVRVAEMMNFAEKLGADTVTLSGQQAGDELITYARSKNISKMIIGKPRRTRLQELIFGSIVNDLARKCGEIDLYMISGEKQEHVSLPRQSISEKFSWIHALRALAVVALCTGLNLLLRPYLAHSNLIMIYLLGVIWVAYRYGKRISFITSFVSVLLFDYLFVPPYFTFVVSHSEYLITFAIMLAVGFLISTLTGRLRHQTEATRLREERNQALYALSRDLAKSSRPEDLFRTGAHHLHEHFKCPVVLLAPDSAKKLTVRAALPEGSNLNPAEKAVIQWVYEHKKMAGRRTETLPASSGLYLPLVGIEKTAGVLGLFPGEDLRFADPDHFHLLEMFAGQIAAAVEGAEFAETTLKAENEIEKERLRNLLLSSFSYELPGPLSEISQAASELLSPEISGNAEKRNALVKQIREKAQQLNKLAEELPKIIKSQE